MQTPLPANLFCAKLQAWQPGHKRGTNPPAQTVVACWESYRSLLLLLLLLLLLWLLLLLLLYR